MRSDHILWWSNILSNHGQNPTINTYCKDVLSLQIIIDDLEKCFRSVIIKTKCTFFFTILQSAEGQCVIWRSLRVLKQMEVCVVFGFAAEERPSCVVFMWKPITCYNKATRRNAFLHLNLFLQVNKCVFWAKKWLFERVRFKLCGLSELSVLIFYCLKLIGLLRSLKPALHN